MSWTLHPNTKKLRKALEQESKQALETLVAKARVSQDAEVRSAYEHYRYAQKGMIAIDEMESAKDS
jgi:hypothetical protein